MEGVEARPVASSAAGERPRRAPVLRLIALLVLMAPAEAVAEQLCLHGCPVGAAASNQTISRTLYVLSNNGARKFADWVAYRITRDTVGTTKRRNFKRDPDIPASETLSPPDYRGAREAIRVDRGHQAPLAAFTKTADWNETNFLSNITPQLMDLNEGPWERLESAERTLAKQSGISGVYSFTGPLYERQMPNLPNANRPHTVPSGYWKVIAVEQAGIIRTAAFIMSQNTPRGADYCASMVTLREIEQRSKLTLFPGIQADRRAELEDAVGPLASDLGCSTTSPEKPTN